MKSELYRLSLRLFVALSLLVVASCSDDDDWQEPDVPEQEDLHPRFVTESNGSLVNYENFDYDFADSTVIEMRSTVMGAQGKVTEYTINAVVLGGMVTMPNDESDNGAIPLKLNNPATPKGVTVVNKGHITVHTKDLLEKYKAVCRGDDETKRYYSLRVLVMYAGENSSVINDGTIDVYFDHDPDSRIMVYCMALNAGSNSQIINNGTINFHGNGSVKTRFRGMATFGNSISAINYGTMTSELQMCDDARFITTGGDFCNVVNAGTMVGRQPGKFLAMTRYGNSNLANDGHISLTTIDWPQGYTTVNGSEDEFACAMYEPLNNQRSEMPALINRGSIEMKVETSDNSSPNLQSYGMMADLMSNYGVRFDLNFVNDGSIVVSQTGPVKCRMGEAGFIARQAAVNSKAGVQMRIGRWKTRLRDFGKTQDLFVSTGVKADLGNFNLKLTSADNYVPGTVYSVAPTDLIYDATHGAGRYDIKSANSMQVTLAANEENYVLDWNQEAQTVALNKK